MRQFKNIYLIGTSHISEESVKKVEETILKKKPAFVAIELDKKRFMSLMGNQKKKYVLQDIRKVGIRGFMFNLIGAYVEKKLGKMVGIKPGSEMKAAVKSAQKVKAKIALIDQDIDITLKRITRRITWKEKVTFVKELIGSLFLRKQKIKFNLKKVPSEKVIKRLTLHLKKSYPSLHLTLIDERNEYMAKALYKLSTTNQGSKIVAVVGAGHVTDIIELLKNEVGVKR